MKILCKLLAAVLVLSLLPAAVSAHPFADVPAGCWFDESVSFVYDTGLMNGTGEATFSPEADMNRAMVVTVLYRMAGSPEISGAPAPFTDVDHGSFYGKPVAWAYENGIVSGISATEFAPGAPVNRSQLVTFFYRFARYLGCDVEARADLSGYADSGRLPAFAADAFSWAVHHGIVNGISATELSPAGTANRAQCATILCRVAKLVGFAPAPQEPELTLDRSKLILPVGGSAAMAVTYTGSGSLRWTSSHGHIAAVTQEGVITALSEGTAYVTVTDGTLTATCKVVVERTPGLRINLTERTLTEHDTYQIDYTYNGDPSNLVWSSSDPAIAEVDSNGVVTARSVGDATITVTDSFIEATCSIKVLRYQSFRFLDVDLTLFRGQSYQLKYSYDSDASELEWSSDEEEIATVDQNGVVTALDTGDTDIWVDARDGYYRLNIHIREVHDNATAIIVRGADGPFYDGVTRYAGDYVEIDTWNKPIEATRYVIVRSSDESVVAIESTKPDYNSYKTVLRFKSAGTATITLTSGDGAVSQSYTITVKDGYDFDPGDRQLTPEEFADYATRVMCANGFTYDSTCTGWRQMVLPKERLDFNNAVSTAHARAHEWWPNGCRACQILYIGQNDDGNYVFHTCWG